MTAEKKPDESVVATINKTMQEGKMTQLGPNRLMLAEHAHQSFVASPETDTPPDALLDSKYWAHYSVNPNLQLQPGNFIYVMPEDGTYFMELLVRSTYRGGVNVKELRRVIFDKADEASGEVNEHEFRWSGPSLKWRVIRKLDKRELVNGLPNKEAAQEWLRNHLKAIAA
jgi:hypothetical protein